MLEFNFGDVSGLTAARHRVCAKYQEVEYGCGECANCGKPWYFCEGYDT